MFAFGAYESFVGDDVDGVVDLWVDAQRADPRFLREVP